MNYVCFLLVAFGFLAQASGWAQEPAASSNTLAYENGAIAESTYSNECFGLSMPIPDGWQSNELGASGKARHLPGGGIALLMIGHPREGSIPDTVILTARDAKGSAPTVQEFVSTTVHAQVNADKEHRELLHDASLVEYSGQHFFRADYKLSMNGRQMYSAFAYTKFRGFYLGATVVAGSPAGLEESVQSLQHISFREDAPNSSCVMKGDDPSTGIVAGVISSAPHISTSGQSQPIRVSQKVSQALLLKTVPPVYPDEARYGRIQGQVVLQVQIDKDGEVQQATLVSGHPLLAPAAIQAVKQWKYKPYTLEGQALAVETRVTVNFALSGG
jgi:TonB family protein